MWIWVQSSAVMLKKKKVRWGSECPQFQLGKILGACWTTGLAKLVNSMFNERPCLKNKVKSDRQRYLTLNSGLHTVHMYVHMCTCMHISKKEYNLGRHVSLYSWKILMRSNIRCLSNTIKNILHHCLLPLVSPPSLHFCFYGYIDHLHLSPYRRAALEELQTNIDSTHFRSHQAFF